MIRKRRFCRLFCCVVTAWLFIVPAFAAFDPDQVHPDERDAVTYCIENGYLDVEPDGLWHGARCLRPEQFTNALMAAFFPDQEDVAIEDQGEWLHEQGFITAPELRRLTDDRAVNYIMVWRITQVLSGNWPMPAELFPEIKNADGLTGVYADCRATVIRMGLAAGSERSTVRIRKSDFAVYFYCLLTGDYEKIERDLSDQPGYGLIDLDRSVLTPVNYMAWNGFFKGFGDLPEKYVDMFRDDGWKVVFSPVYRNAGRDRAVQGGLCVYGAREIYLNHCDERGLYHEFGHYLAMALGIREKLPGLFRSEGADMEDLLGGYSQTSCDEYFAECVSYWLAGGDPEPFSEMAPETFALMGSIFCGDTCQAEAA